MSDEIILHKANSLIMEGDSALGMANSHFGDLYLRSESVDFVAAGGVLGLANMKNNKFIDSEVVKQKNVCVPLEYIAGLECIIHKSILKKYATFRLHLYNGAVLFFSIGNGKLEATTQWLDAIRLQCVKNNLKRPYLKVNGEMVN